MGDDIILLFFDGTGDKTWFLRTEELLKLSGSTCSYSLRLLEYLLSTLILGVFVEEPLM